MTEEKQKDRGEGNKLPRVTLTLSPALYQRVLEEADKQYIRPSTFVEGIIRDVVTEMDKRVQAPKPDEPSDGGIFAKEEETTDGGIF